MKSVLFVCLLLLLIQPIAPFCIRNRVKDNTRINIKQSMALWPHRIFSADLNPNEQQCCNYKNPDCSYRMERNDNATFTFNFYNDRVEDSGRQTVVCTAGGAIVFTGMKDSIVAHCTKDKDDVTKVYQYKAEEEFV